MFVEYLILFSDFACKWLHVCERDKRPRQRDKKQRGRDTLRGITVIIVGPKDEGQSVSAQKKSRLLCLNCSSYTLSEFQIIPIVLASPSFFFIYLFIYLWLCWVFVSVWGLSLVAASRGHFSSRCTSLSLSRPLLLRSTGSRRAGSVTVAHGPSCSAACGILPDQGSNPGPLHRQADSQPLRHQGSPSPSFLIDLCSLLASVILSMNSWPHSPNNKLAYQMGISAVLAGFHSQACPQVLRLSHQF